MVKMAKTVDQAWNIDPELATYIPPTLYAGTGNSKYRNPVSGVVIQGGSGAAGIGGGTGGGGGISNTAKVITDLNLEAVGTLPGSVIPDGFQHYSHCICFDPTKRPYPNYSMEHAELEMYSE